MSNKKNTTKRRPSRERQKIGRMGGEKTKRVRGRTFYSAIGKKGGAKSGANRRRKLGAKGWTKLAQMGGKATLKRHGRKFFSEIGRKSARMAAQRNKAR